jgi:hypothetical protein
MPALMFLTSIFVFSSYFGMILSASLLAFSVFFYIWICIAREYHWIEFEPIKGHLYFLLFLFFLLFYLRPKKYTTFFIHFVMGFPLRIFCILVYMCIFAHLFIHTGGWEVTNDPKWVQVVVKRISDFIDSKVRHTLFTVVHYVYIIYHSRAHLHTLFSLLFIYVAP